jgi:hypothetical protein
MSQDPARKVVVVGLGTTGLRIVQLAARKLRREYSHLAGARWARFVAFETAADDPDGSDSSDGLDALVRLALNPADLQACLDAPRVAGAGHDLATWGATILPDPGGWGARDSSGGSRALGRLSLLHAPLHTAACAAWQRVWAELTALPADPELDAAPELSQKPPAVYLVGSLAGASSGMAADLGYLLHRWSGGEVTAHGLFLLPPAACQSGEPAAINAYHALRELAHWMLPDVEWSQRLPEHTEAQPSRQRPFGVVRLLQAAASGAPALEACIASATELLAAITAPSGAQLIRRDDELAARLAAQPAEYGRHASFSLAGCAALGYAVDAQRQAASVRLLSRIGDQWLKQEPPKSPFATLRDVVDLDLLDDFVDELIPGWSKAAEVKPDHKISDLRELHSMCEAERGSAGFHRFDSIIRENRKRRVGILLDRYAELVRQHLPNPETGPAFLAARLREVDARLARWQDKPGKNGEPEKQGELTILTIKRKHRLNESSGMVSRVLSEVEDFAKTRPSPLPRLKRQMDHFRREHQERETEWNRRLSAHEARAQQALQTHLKAFAFVCALDWLARHTCIEPLRVTLQRRAEALECLASELEAGLSHDSTLAAEAYEEVLRHWGASKALEESDTEQLEAAAAQPLFARVALWCEEIQRKVTRHDTPFAAADAVPPHAETLLRLLSVEAEQLLDTAGEDFHISHRLDHGTAQDLWAEAGSALSDLQQIGESRPGSLEIATVLLHSGREGADDTVADRLTELEERLRALPSAGELETLATGDPYRILIIREAHGLHLHHLPGYSTAGHWSQARGMFPTAHSRADVEWADPDIVSSDWTETRVLWLLCLLLGRPADLDEPANKRLAGQELSPVPHVGWYRPRPDGFFLQHRAGLTTAENGLLLSHSLDAATRRLLHPEHQAGLRSLQGYLEELKKDRLRTLVSEALDAALADFERLQVADIDAAQARALLRETSHLHPWSAIAWSASAQRPVPRRRE